MYAILELVYIREALFFEKTCSFLTTNSSRANCDHLLIL